MRLIDADELLKKFDPDGEPVDPIAVRAKIVQQPTAYDVDKVVEQLEKEQLSKILVIKGGRTNGKSIAYGGYLAYQKAIEIVKAGGVNE